MRNLRIRSFTMNSFYVGPSNWVHFLWFSRKGFIVLKGVKAGTVIKIRCCQFGLTYLHSYIPGDYINRRGLFIDTMSVQATKICWKEKILIQASRCFSFLVGIWHHCNKTSAWLKLLPFPLHCLAGPSKKQTIVESLYQVPSQNSNRISYMLFKCLVE